MTVGRDRLYKGGQGERPRGREPPPPLREARRSRYLAGVSIRAMASRAFPSAALSGRVRRAVLAACGCVVGTPLNRTWKSRRALYADPRVVTLDEMPGWK